MTAAPIKTRRNRYALGGTPQLDGRSAAAKRIKALARQYGEALGNPTDPVKVIAIKSTAEAQVIYEAARANALAKGDSLGRKSLDALLRMEGQLRRQLRQLGLGDHPNLHAPPRPKSLAQQRRDDADRILGKPPSPPEADRVDRALWERHWAERDRALATPPPPDPPGATTHVAARAAGHADA
jgi:hypothetical protein